MQLERLRVAVLVFAPLLLRQEGSGIEPVVGLTVQFEALAVHNVEDVRHTHRAA